MTTNKETTMDRTLKIERAQERSFLRKYPNRRLYDVHASSYVTLLEERIRTRLLAGERIMMAGGKRRGEDVTAEVLAALLVELVREQRISAAQLLGFLKASVANVPAGRATGT